MSYFGRKRTKYIRQMTEPEINYIARLVLKILNLSKSPFQFEMSGFVRGLGCMILYDFIIIIITIILLQSNSIFVRIWLVTFP